MIKEIHIQNFRSIKNLRFSPSNLCAIIGPNSTGKTNVLKALDLVLGEGWTTKAKVARELFQNPEEPITISIQFNTPVVVQAKSIHSISLQMCLTPELSAKTTCNGGETFYGHDQFKRACHFIYIPSERHLTSELRVSQWTMLGKLMRLIYENYVNAYDGDSNELRRSFQQRMKDAKDFIEADFDPDPSVVTFRKFSTVFRDHCLRNGHGLANDFEPVLNIYNLNWFYKTLQIQVHETLPDRHFDSEEVGAGMQNLLLLSIFQTYADLMRGSVVFGIEEPEIYLYPQAQRSLYRNFQELSMESQIFYTTHNPNFVDAARPDDLLLLRKTGEKGTYALKKDSHFSSIEAEKQRFRIYTHFHPGRNELFFARKILLVEGDSDKIVFSTLCERLWNIDLDREGISIVSCGGKGGVMYFLGVCKLIGHEDYFAVWDQDEPVEDQRNILSSALKGRLGIELQPNLEECLRIPSGNDALKVRNAYNWASDTNLTASPTVLEAVKDFLSGNSDEIPF